MKQPQTFAARLLLPGDVTKYGTVRDCVGDGPYVRVEFRGDYVDEWGVRVMARRRTFARHEKIEVTAYEKADLGSTEIPQEVKP